VLRIEGAKDHPITRGVLCAKVRDSETRVSAEGRLLQPLRRTGPKGAGPFQPISWEEALDLIASRFTPIIASHGAEALLPFHYRGSMGIVKGLMVWSSNQPYLDSGMRLQLPKRSTHALHGMEN